MYIVSSVQTRELCRICHLQLQYKLGVQAYNGDLGLSPQRGTGTLPLVKGQKCVAFPPPDAGTLGIWMFNGNGKFVHFSEIWKRRKPQLFLLFCKNEVN